MNNMFLTVFILQNSAEIITIPLNTAKTEFKGILFL